MNYANFLRVILYFWGISLCVFVVFWFVFLGCFTLYFWGISECLFTKTTTDTLQKQTKTLLSTNIILGNDIHIAPAPQD